MDKTRKTLGFEMPSSQESDPDIVSFLNIVKNATNNKRRLKVYGPRRSTESYSDTKLVHTSRGLYARQLESIRIRISHHSSDRIRSKMQVITTDFRF